MLRICPDPNILKRRICLLEHPFGTVKWYGGAHYLLCKGKEKATAELGWSCPASTARPSNRGLSFLACNLRRAINLVGSDALVKVMQREKLFFSSLLMMVTQDIID